MVHLSSVVARFILRFEGEGNRPARDIRRIRALPNSKVLDESSRMILIEAPASGVTKLIETLPHWKITPEHFVPLPDPRPKLRKSLS